MEIGEILGKERKEERETGREDDACVCLCQKGNLPVPGRWTPCAVNPLESQQADLSLPPVFFALVSVPCTLDGSSMGAAH